MRSFQRFRDEGFKHHTYQLANDARQSNVHRIRHPVKGSFLGTKYIPVLSEVLAEFDVPAVSPRLQPRVSHLQRIALVKYCLPQKFYALLDVEDLLHDLQLQNQ